MSANVGGSWCQDRVFAGFVGRSVDRYQPSVSIPDSDRKLGESLSTTWAGLPPHPKNPVFESGDDVVVREAVDGVDEGCDSLAERLLAPLAREADLPRQLNRTHGGRGLPHRGGVPSPGKEHRCRPTRGVYTISEVVVLEREGRLGCGSSARSRKTFAAGFRTRSRMDRPAPDCEVHSVTCLGAPRARCRLIGCRSDSPTLRSRGSGNLEPEIRIEPRLIIVAADRPGSSPSARAPGTARPRGMTRRAGLSASSHEATSGRPRGGASRRQWPRIIMSDESVWRRL